MDVNGDGWKLCTNRWTDRLDGRPHLAGLEHPEQRVEEGGHQGGGSQRDGLRHPVDGCHYQHVGTARFAGGVHEGQRQQQQGDQDHQQQLAGLPQPVSRVHPAAGPGSHSHGWRRHQHTAQEQQEEQEEQEQEEQEQESSVLKPKVCLCLCRSPPRGPLLKLRRSLHLPPSLLLPPMCGTVAPQRVGGRRPGARRTPRGLWWPLVCCLSLTAMVTGATLAPEGKGPAGTVTATAEGVTETWNTTTSTTTTTTSTTRLQPDLQTEALTEVPTESQTEGYTTNYTGLSCPALLPPRRGSFYVEAGTGVSVGTVLAFWCRDGYQLVGSDKIRCGVHRGAPEWSNHMPACEAIPRPEDRGLRLAVLASVVSGVVILAMSLAFVLCCVQDRRGRGRSQREGGRGRRSAAAAARRRGRDSWLEREGAGEGGGDWDSFPPPKIFHLSQHMDPRLAPDSPLYLTAGGGLSGYQNRGYHRSQESLLKTPLPGLYRSESQLYSQVVLQRVPTPIAPTAPPAPGSSSSSSSTSNTMHHLQAHLLGHYPTAPGPYPPHHQHHQQQHPGVGGLAYPAPIYPNPNPAPQRPWQ